PYSTDSGPADRPGLWWPGVDDLEGLIMTDETLRQNILTDLQSRTQTDAEPLERVQIGNDAGVATYYNTTEADGQYLETRLSKAALRQRLGDIKAGGLMAGLRAYGAGNGTYSALVA